MRLGSRRFPAFSTALALRARCWKAQPVWPSFTAWGSLSSLASSLDSRVEAMFRKAVQEYRPPPPKNEVPAPSPSSTTSTSSIRDFLKNGRPTQKLYTGLPTSQERTPSSTYFGSSRPPTQSQPMATVNDVAATVSALQGRKRTSSEMRGIERVLNKTDSFQEISAHVDLTQSPSPPSKRSFVTKASVPIQPEFELNPDDFDSDIDLDFESPKALPTSDTPRRPLNQVSPNKSPSSLLFPMKVSTPHISALQSSAITWSSSPLSHMQPPPRSNMQQTKSVSTLAAPEISEPADPVLISSEPSIDANPKSWKRRTIPWVQQREEALRLLREEEELALEEKSQFDKYRADFTPLPKDNKDSAMPWNTTASEIKNRKNNVKRGTGKVKSCVVDGALDEARAAANERVAPIFLSSEQQNVLDLVVKQGKGCFFTGSAGTGKSVLMRAIIAELRKIHVKNPGRVAITASTGLAACNIGGVTLHSFSGIGLGKEDVDTLVKKIKKNVKAKKRWLEVKILVVDEISMVDGELFDKLEGIARKIRNNGRPFGGIQLVITGDFFQLPPVPDFGNNSRAIKFAFEATTWPTAISHTIGLTQVFRQRDPVFANMLNEMRLGKISDATIKTFRNLERDLDEGDSLQATELFPTRSEVENANGFKMRKLKGKTYTFKAQDSGTITDPVFRGKLLANCMAPPVIELKKGAQVMLIKNLDDGLVNGLLGQVIGFMNQHNFEYYIEHEDEFQNGEHIGKPDTKMALTKRLQAAANKDNIDSDPNLLPVVRFSIADGTSRDCQIRYEDWKFELPNGEVQAQRTQLPLILAWALSIHKAQGQTLEKVKVDLRRVFENGQAYVALSRATSQQGLCVKNFNKKAIMAHPKVAEFYNSLYSVNAALKHPKVVAAAATKDLEQKSGVNNYNDAKKNITKDIVSHKPPATTFDSFNFDEDEEAEMSTYY